MKENQDRAQRIINVSKEIVERTLHHHRDNENIIKLQIEACSKWDDDFLLAVEKILKDHCK